MSADHLLDLSSADTMLNTITIALITWAVAVTIAIAIMVAVVARRLRMLRARARRLADRQTSDYYPSGVSGVSHKSSVIDMRGEPTDRRDLSLDEDLDDPPEPEAPRPNIGAATLAARLTNVILPDHFNANL